MSRCLYTLLDMIPFILHPLIRQEESGRDCVGADAHPGDDALPGEGWYMRGNVYIGRGNFEVLWIFQLLLEVHCNLGDLSIFHS